MPEGAGRDPPDVITVDDPDHKAMTVDPIRAARSDMFIRPNEGRRKIYVIPRGQDMNGARRTPCSKFSRSRRTTARS